MTESIQLNSLNGEALEIAKICNINGDDVLNGGEINIFNAAYAEYQMKKSFFVKGKKYVPDIFTTGKFKEEKVYDITNKSDQTAIYNKHVPNIVAANNNSSKSDPFAGYDEKKGRELAMVAYADRNKKKVKNKKGKWTYFLGKCAKFVKNAMVKVGLMPEYITGNACNMLESLRKNPNLREVPSKEYKNAPLGTIFWYAPGAENYDPVYGHIEITSKKLEELWKKYNFSEEDIKISLTINENGQALEELKNKYNISNKDIEHCFKKVGVSDGVTINLRPPTAMFIPIKT